MAKPDFPDLIPARNQTTHRKHRREVFWQITFPLTLGLLVILFGCVLPILAVTQGGEVRVWADISLIWLILPAMFLSLIPLALLAGLVYGVTRLIGIIPGFMFRIQNIFAVIRERVRVVSDKSVEPVLRGSQVMARLQVIFSGNPSTRRRVEE